MNIYLDNTILNKYGKVIRKQITDCGSLYKEPFLSVCIKNHLLSLVKIWSIKLDCLIHLHELLCTWLIHLEKLDLTPPAY